MSDFNSSLPVRTENNGDVAAKIVDGTTPSQTLTVDAAGKITVKLDDAAGTGLTSQANGAQQALDVGIDVAGVQIDPRQIRALTAADVVTANQGTSPWITKDQADGPVAPGTVAAFSQLAGGQYNTTPPTLTNTQQSALQLDAAGRLLVDAAITSTDDHNYGTVGANTLRTAAQIGNATGAADFNFGTVGAQTLRTAAEIGNATGAADFNAGATGAQTLRTSSNQGTANTVANSWPVKITDGTDTANVTAAGDLNVVDSNFPATVDTNYGTVGASTIRTASEIGNATGAASFNYGAVGAQTLRVASQIGNATGAADFNAGATGAQTLRTSANQGAPNTIANAWPTLLTDGTDTVAVNTDGSINVVVTDATPGTPINDYKRAIAIAAGASDNHDYTVTAAKTLYLNQIEASGSGKTKAEVEIETGVATGVFTTKWSQFNSTADPNMTIHIDNPIAVAAGVRVRVVLTNKDILSADLYSTISGYELP